MPWQGQQGVNPLRIPPWNAQGPHQANHMPGRMVAPGTDVHIGQTHWTKRGNRQDTTRVGPEQQQYYPFRMWEKYVRIWESITSVEAHRRVPLCIQHMAVVAQAILVEDFDMAHRRLYVNGGQIPNGNNPLPGHRPRICDMGHWITIP